MSSKQFNVLLVGLGIALVIGLLVLLGRKKTVTTNANPMSPDQRQAIEITPYARYANWMYAQSGLETGGFTSSLFKNYNNAFGMNLPKKRPFLGNPGPSSSEGQRAAYDSVRQSWEDVLEWFRYNSFPKNLENVSEYVAHLKQFGYFTAKEEDYLAGLRAWASKLNITL